MQSRLGSLIETVVNMGIGFVVALISQLVIFPWYGIVVDMHANVEITAWFTVVSLVRTYFVRRWFNAGIQNTIRKFCDRT